ncbi:TetR/AcrR family transcriptional regulator [Amycolatopsis pithecellobii]|uniref:TetR family transcriptional regulator n=1 Tax=Amycolatopsis pithecellobii TaxID=664692 RepID=A0A6N7ZBC3_9PSEU|nr:TetR family transcriptional regulator [Amycolatopsis pithecellobii]MTD59009.1 TetR family transcriptional regulator [Amycolatopsis pithecellobii]
MTAPSKPRRLTPKGQATRNRIVDAATALIARQGVAGTSIEDVRAEAGVSGSQLYHYFESKQELIRAVITRHADPTLDSTRPRIEALDSFDALRAWADAAIEQQLANDCRGYCNLGTLAGELGVSDEESRTDIADGFLRWKDLILNGLKAMRDRGELRADADLDELSYALLTGLQGGVLLTQIMRDVRPLEAVLNSALAYIHSFATAA